MVSEAEYAALKKAASASTSSCERAPPPPTASSSRDKSPASELGRINQRLISRDNAKLRDIVDGTSDSSSSDGSDVEDGGSSHNTRYKSGKVAEGEEEGFKVMLDAQQPEAEGEHGGGGIEFSFLPVGQRRAAKKFLHLLLAHPAVDVECGQVYVRGRKIGHIVFVLNYLFGRRASTLSNTNMLSSFLRQTNLARLVPAASIGRASSKVKEKGSLGKSQHRKHTTKEKTKNRGGRSVENNSKKRMRTPAESPPLNLAAVAHLQQ